jgi:hypothetical protein
MTMNFSEQKFLILSDGLTQEQLLCCCGVYFFVLKDCCVRLGSTGNFLTRLRKYIDEHVESKPFEFDTIYVAPCGGYRAVEKAYLRWFKPEHNKNDIRGGVSDPSILPVRNLYRVTAFDSVHLSESELHEEIQQGLDALPSCRNAEIRNAHHP